MWRGLCGWCVLYCIVLYCVVLCCVVLCCAVLWCGVVCLLQLLKYRSVVYIVTCLLPNVSTIV